MSQVLDATLDEFAEAIRERGIAVTRGEPVTVWGIRTQLEQVVRNLVGNAVKFTGAAAAPAIDVRAEDRGDVVEWAVRDNGIGIDPPYHAKIFEVFQQLDDIDTEGTGVELALVKKIVESNGGRVSVESEKGRGARFSFTWPKAPGPVTPA